jgi:putative DNA primase/helicase
MQCYPFIHAEDPDCTEATDNMRLVCTHDCPPQSLEWLWPEKIPLGKVSLLIGDPGTGKSLVAIDIAARASRGLPWPDECTPLAPREENRLAERDAYTSASGLHAPCSVLLLSASDDLADTIRPRLDAAGADPRRVFVIPSINDLRDDFNQLRAAVNRAPNCRLIIIDPINAYVGPGDAHFQTVVRKVLAPLAELASKKRIAVIAITHLRKSDGAAIHRAAGSMGFVGAARAVWSVSRDPENPARHLLLPVKNNVGPEACGLAYTIQQTAPFAAPALVWDPAPLTAPKPKKSVPPPAERAEAREWLRQALAPGPRPAKDVLDEGQLRGFLRRTLQRAFHELDGHTAKRGLHQGWWWSLADQSAENQSPETHSTPDAFEDVTYEDDVAAQQQVDKMLSERIACYAPSHFLNDSIPNVNAAPKKTSATSTPRKTGHPILDAILDDLRNSSPTISLRPATANTS